MRVALFEPKADDATSFYRSRGVWHYLAKRDAELRFLIPQGANWIDAVQYDVAVFQRPCNKADVKAITLMKECGVRVIVDYDDDLLNVADHNPSYQHHHYNKVSTMACIDLADTVIVSTEKLKESFAPYNKNIAVIPNALNDYIFKVKDKKPFANNKVAYYRGGTSHQRDVYMHREFITQTIKENPDWQFYFFGDRFQFLEAECGDNYLAFGFMPPLQFMQSLNALQPSAHFTYLENTPFNLCKSNCSWIEATYAGAATLTPLRLPEFDIASIQVNTPPQMNLFNGTMKDYHDLSWQYIQDALLLSDVNRLRAELL